MTTEVAAPPALVWEALTVPEQVEEWDGVRVLDVPADYPQPGQHARWRSPLGPLDLTLHDRIRVIEPERLMVAEIDVGFVHVDEEYRLEDGANGGTTLVTGDEVRSRVPGLDRLAVRLTRGNVTASMERLREYCEARHRDR